MQGGEEPEGLEGVGRGPLLDDERLSRERLAWHQGSSRGLVRLADLFGFDCGPGGVTAPPEMIIFIPSPTAMSSSMTSALGIISRKPLVGFGVVGTKIVQISLPAFSCASPWTVLVRNPIVQEPFRGNSTSTTLLNMCRLWELNVFTICRTVLYTALTPGIVWMKRSPMLKKNLPKT